MIEAAAYEMGKNGLIAATGGVAGVWLGPGLVAESVSVTGRLLPLTHGAKIARQMASRGWTDVMIREAISAGQKFQAINKANGNPAVRFVHPGTGQSVVVDMVTKRIIHVGGRGFLY